MNKEKMNLQRILRGHQTYEDLGIERIRSGYPWPFGKCRCPAYFWIHARLLGKCESDVPLKKVIVDG